MIQPPKHTTPLLPLCAGIFLMLCACDTEEPVHDEASQSQLAPTDLDETEIDALMDQVDTAIESTDPAMVEEFELASPPPDPQAPVCWSLEYSICIGICWSNYYDKFPECSVACHKLYC